MLLPISCAFEKSNLRCGVVSAMEPLPFPACIPPAVGGGSCQQAVWSWKQRQRGHADSAIKAALSQNSSKFVKPLKQLHRPPLPCQICKGFGEVPCPACGGRGKLQKGGYHQKNPLHMNRVIGSKWTAMEQTFGWRHFFVHSKQRGSGKGWFLEMVAACDETSRFWVNSQNLKDRKRWSMGWLQNAEMSSPRGSEAVSATQCKACKGRGFTLCLLCATKDFQNPNQLNIIEV